MLSMIMDTEASKYIGFAGVTRNRLAGRRGGVDLSIVVRSCAVIVASADSTDLYG